MLMGMQLEDDLLYKLSSAEGDMTEDLALIESLEESKRVADEISEKVAEAKTTEEQINEARNKVCGHHGNCSHIKYQPMTANLDTYLCCEPLTAQQSACVHATVYIPLRNCVRIISGLSYQAHLVLHSSSGVIALTGSMQLTFTDNVMPCSTELWLPEEPCSSSC